MSVTTSCPACGSIDSQACYDVPDHEYDVARTAVYRVCAGCGTLRQSPMPGQEELSAFYPPGYHSFGAAGLLAAVKDQARLRRLQSFVNRDRAVILDYGCGDGRFIKEAARRQEGWTCWGFEVAPRKEHQVFLDGRVQIVRGGLDDLLSLLPACDAVTMNHVIEHLPDPRAVLEALHRRMTAGGVMEGQTPAADSLERRVFGTKWSGFHAPRHTVIFSRQGLKQVLTSAGFASACVTPAFNPAGIAVSLASLPHGNSGGTIKRQGAVWLTCVAAAAALYPIELLSRSPGIVNYAARKAATQQ